MMWRYLIPCVFVAAAAAHPERVLGQDDPPTSLQFSTFLGGNGVEMGQAVALDTEGNVYVTGATSSRDFPVVAAAAPFRGGPAGFDVYVARLSPDGAIAYATFLGGGGDEFATSIAVDALGRACVAGATTSNDFPTAGGSVFVHRGGDLLGSDAFLACLSPDGTSVEYATYFGGAGDDTISGLSVGTDGSLFIVGSTSSTDFPVTGGALQPSHAGGLALRTDAFVARFRQDGAGFALSYSTYLGGSMDDAGVSIGSDPGGRAYVTGFTNSSDFPTREPIQPSYAGPLRALEGDAFVAVLSADGGAVEFATYLGGSGNDQATGIALQDDGDVYVGGWTRSRDFPTTAGAFQRIRMGVTDAFLVRLTPTSSGGLQLGYSSLLGGSGNDAAHSIGVDAQGGIVLAGSSTSADLPLRGSIGSSDHGSLADGFVARFENGGTNLLFSTLLGGAFTDVINGVAVEGTGRLCVTGGTASSDYPTTASLQPFPRVASSSGAPETAFLTCLGPGSGPVSIEDAMEVPKRFALYPNYPNPFNPTTTIPFDLREPRRVRLAIYDITGRQIATLVDADHAAGRYLATVDASRWASGVYFYRITAGEFVETRKMVLVR